MIKTGITRIENILSKGATPFRKELKNVSITLYDQICGLPNAESLAQRILLLFSDERGAYKRTYSKRFEAFDKDVLGVLKNHFSKSELLIHDAGVSDGRTSVDFFQKLTGKFKNLSYVASDYNPVVYVIEEERLKVTVSATGKVLEMMYPPFVFSTSKRDSYRHYPMNHLVRKWVQYFKVNPLLKKYLHNETKAKKVYLFSPTALELESKDKDFKLVQHDLLSSFTKRYDVIRAMNVLNQSYFSQREFSKVLKNVYEGLMDGGLLITGSNQESGTLVHGGVYEKTRTGFKVLWRSGDGSPIEDQILLGK